MFTVGRPVKTCVPPLRQADDLWATRAIAANSSASSSAGATAGAAPAAAAGGGGGGEPPVSPWVVIKFMHDKEHWEREIRHRARGRPEVTNIER